MFLLEVSSSSLLLSSLRAFRRARDGEAQGRVDWKRDGLPDAKFEVTGAKCDLRNEQQREKREESREKRQERRYVIEAAQDRDDKEKRGEKR